MYEWLSMYRLGTRTNLAALTNISRTRCPSDCFRSLSSVNNWRTAALEASLFKEFTSRYIVYCVMSDQIFRYGVLLFVAWVSGVFPTSLSITWCPVGCQTAGKGGV